VTPAPELLIALTTSLIVSVLESVMTWPLTEKVWPSMLLSPRAVSRLVVAAGGAVMRVVPLPLVSMLESRVA
jgi:hypothetical protein